MGGTDITGATGLQTVDYAYNIRGWLKQINNPASLGTDLFGFKINYNMVSHGATALYNVIHIITSNLDWTARTIADLYKKDGISSCFSKQ